MNPETSEPEVSEEPAEVVAPTYVPFESYAAVELKIGTVRSAEPVAGSDKLLRLTVDFGEGEPRQVVSGIGKSFLPGSLVGNQYAFVANLAPREMMGLESQAMILAADGEFGLSLVTPTRAVKPGSALH
jgi:methionyl-tRNA synthetase